MSEEPLYSYYNHDTDNNKAGCLFFLSSWYTRKELAFRSAVLYSGSLISGAFSGLIAAGILNGMSGSLGLAAWRWLCKSLFDQCEVRSILN